MVPKEQHALPLTLRTLTRLNPLTSPHIRPQRLDEAQRPTLNISTIMLAHNRLDGLASLISVVEGNGRNVVVQDVGFDDAVEEVAADEAEFAVDGCGGAAGEVPGLAVVVGEGGVGVLEVGDGDCEIIVS